MLPALSPGGGDCESRTLPTWLGIPPAETLCAGVPGPGGRVPSRKASGSQEPSLPHTEVPASMKPVSHRSPSPAAASYPSVRLLEAGERGLCVTSVPHPHLRPGRVPATRPWWTRIPLGNRRDGRAHLNATPWRCGRVEARVAGTARSVPPRRKTSCF